MKRSYNALVDKTGRNWFGTFPDFPGRILVTASTRSALLKKLEYNLGEYLPLHHGPLPKAKFKKFSDIPKDEREGFVSPEVVAVAAPDLNPVSLEVGRLIDASGLKPAVLAAKAGMAASNLSRLRDPRKQGHSVAVLQRLAKAAGKRLIVRFE